MLDSSSGNLRFVSDVKLLSQQFNRNASDIQHYNMKITMDNMYLNLSVPRVDLRLIGVGHWA